MNWKYLFNPLLKFSERSLLILGILSIVAGSLIGHYFSLTFDGAFDTHPLQINLLESLKENFKSLELKIADMNLARKEIATDENTFYVTSRPYRAL